MAGRVGLRGALIGLALSLASVPAANATGLSGARVDVSTQLLGQNVHFAAAAQALAQTFTVNTTIDADDGSCGISHCTLREAIVAANDAPGLDTIAFSIQGPAPHQILIAEELFFDLPLITGPVTIDGSTEPDFAGSPVVELVGHGPSQITGQSVVGLEFMPSSAGSTLRGLSIYGFVWAVYVRQGGDHVFENNYFGLTAAGTRGEVPSRPYDGNAVGIVLSGSARNRIGGSSAQQMNVISGNAAAGVGVEFAGAEANVIRGNRIGTDPSGLVEIGNGHESAGQNSQHGGVSVISGATNTLVGGDGQGDGNLISGNAAGVSIWESSGTTVQGNLIGPDLTGQRGFTFDGERQSYRGIFVVGDGVGTRIGGRTPLARNVISGHFFEGIEIRGQDGVVIEGNYIGVAADGETSLGNGRGVKVQAAEVRIGAGAAGAGNVISGNGCGQIYIPGAFREDGPGDGRAIIEGNLLGPDATGTAVPTAPPCYSTGGGTQIQSAVEIVSRGNRIGGPSPLQRNVISGKHGSGIFLLGADATENVIQGNYIGTDVSGSAALGPQEVGIWILAANNNRIGGTESGMGNVISGHEVSLIHFDDGAITIEASAQGELDPIEGRENVVEGNLVGVAADRTTPLPNTIGVVIDGGSQNRIGGSAAGAGNLIAFNRFDGVIVRQSSEADPPGRASGNTISRNSIHSNGALGITLHSLDENDFRFGSGPTLNDPGDGDIGGNDLQNFPEITDVSSAGGQTTVRGSLNSTPSTVFRIELFRNAACNARFDPRPDGTPQFFGEGETFIGTVDATTDASGKAPFEAIVPGSTVPPQVITATATAPNGSTSEFSGCSANLSLTKRDSADPVENGQSFTYTLTVRNNGPMIPNEVVVTDTLPDEVSAGTITTSQGTCIANPGVGFGCQLGTLNPGATAEITVVVTAAGDAGTTFTNTASVESELPDPDSANNTATETTTITGAQPRGTIVIAKRTLPAGEPAKFAFTGAAAGSIADGELITVSNLAAGTYTSTETIQAGWDLTAISCDDANSTSATETATATFRVEAGETVICTFTNTKRGTIIVAKRTDPPAASGSFTFTGDVAGVIGGTGELIASNLRPGTYRSTETDPAPAFTLAAIACNDTDSSGSLATRTATFSLGAGETVTCTFTNRKSLPGSVTLKKTTNGVVDPTKDIAFVLAGAGLLAAGVSSSTYGDLDGVLSFNNAALIPGEKYSVCETPVPAGFSSFWRLDGSIITPYNPDASLTPPEDLGVRCYDFQVAGGQRRFFEVDNSRPGGDPRTIGYWKNWNRCTSGNQATTAAKNGGAAAGFFIVEDLLPKPIGDLNVATCEQATKLLSKQDQKGRNKSSDAAYELGAQLLASRLNLAAGAETCASVQQATIDGQELLDQINFNGDGDYLGSKSKDPRRARALSLAATLDRYNNGSLC